MSAVKGKNTKPELIVRKYLFSKGLRYRLHVKKLAGKPDLVFPKYKTVVFVDGCFWHGHEGCKAFKMPKSNEFYWENKIRKNKARDISSEYVLKTEGWKVLRVWECEIRNPSIRQNTLENLYQSIVSPSGYNLEEDLGQIAAEDEAEYGSHL